MRDIRDLKHDPHAYAAELERRWGGLLSYRYIGRKHSSMDLGEVDNTVAIRRDMRNASGGLLVAPLSISSPEGAVGSDRETVPNPVIHSCQILDPGHDVRRIEVVESESLHLGLQMRSWHVMFLARGKVGPFRADAEAFRGTEHTVGARVSLYDEGSESRLITCASAVFELVN